MTQINPEQTTTYRYDALGRQIGQSISFAKLKNGGDESKRANQSAKLTDPISYETTTQFDAITGLVTRRTLADGRVLKTSRSSSQFGASAKSLTMQTATASKVEDWVRDVFSVSVADSVAQWLPNETIAQDIQVDAFNGLTHVVSGNGLTTQKQFDIAGRLTRLEVQNTISNIYGYGTGPRITSVQSLGTQPHVNQKQEIQTNDDRIQNTGNQKQSNGPTLGISNAQVGMSSMQRFEYEGFGRLKRDAQSDLARPLTMQKVSTASSLSMAPSDSAPSARVDLAKLNVKRDRLGRVVQDEKFNYSYTAAGQLATVIDVVTKQPVAQYTYNSLRQRVSKTVKGQTTFYLWIAYNSVSVAVP